MRIFQNLRYKALALGIALLLWAVASGTSDLDRGFDVPIAFESVPENLVIVDKSTDEVNLRVQGSRASLRNVSPGDMEYRLVVDGAKQGVADYEVDVTRFDLPRGARIVASSPSSIEVKFERRGTKVVRVRPDLEGEPAAGYLIADVAVEPDRVRITGARSEVLRLTEVITETVALSGISESFEREVKLTVGARNAWVEDPESVRVRVTVNPSEATGEEPS